VGGINNEIGYVAMGGFIIKNNLDGGYYKDGRYR